MRAGTLLELAESLGRLRCPDHDHVLPLNALELSIEKGQVHCKLIKKSDGVCCEKLMKLAQQTAGVRRPSGRPR